MVSQSRGKWLRGSAGGVGKAGTLSRRKGRTFDSVFGPDSVRPGFLSVFPRDSACFPTSLRSCDMIFVIKNKYVRAMPWRRSS